MKYAPVLIACFVTAAAFGLWLRMSRDTEHEHAPSPARASQGPQREGAAHAPDNSIDPVSGESITASHSYQLEYHGFTINFSSEQNRARFERRPIEFLHVLSLEKSSSGEVTLVDAASYADPPTMPAACPLMGGKIYPEDEVYILHRGWRIYFCCWSGCATNFLADPAKHYHHYGLVERKGQLVALND